jgi:hypothetical protein
MDIMGDSDQFVAKIFAMFMKTNVAITFLYNST